MKFDLMRALGTEGKAIPAHPALMDSDTPTTIYSPGANRVDAKLSDRSSKRYMEGFGGNQAIDWLGDCLRLYADTISTAEWRLERDNKPMVRLKDENTPSGALVAPKELLRLLDEPNPFMLYDELVELLVYDLFLAGNGYWYKWRTNDDGQPLALYRLAPPYVKIIPGPFGPKGYEYQPPGARDPLLIPYGEVMHFKLPNPNDSYYGMGIVQSGGRSFDLELSLTEDQASYFENKADPSLIVSSERRVPRDVFNKLRAQLRARVAGTRKSGELLVLEAGLKATSLTPSARERMYAELTKLSRDRIFAMFRASPMLFGLMDEVSGGNKVSDARREFDTKAMRPFMDKLQRRITAWLTTAWDCDFRIDYRYIMPHEELVKQVGELAAIPGITVRELRRQLAPLGITESTGDPEIDELVLNLPGEELDENGQGGTNAFADRPLPGEAGRPPRGENTRAFNGRVRQKKAAKKPVRDLTEILGRLGEIEREAKAVTFEEQKPASVGRRLRDEERPSDSTAGVRAREVDSAASYIKNGFSDAITTLERGLLDHVEGKAFDPKSLVKRIRKSQSWATFASMLTAVLEEGTRRAVSASVIHSAESGRIPDEELDYDAIVNSVIHRSDGVRGITKNLKDAIAVKIARVIEKGGDRAAVEAAVRESVASWKESKAETVALTEAVHAYNEASLTVAESTGASEVMVADGTDDDEPCRDADGQVWTIEYAREHRLEHPRCRRAFVALPA